MSRASNAGPDRRPWNSKRDGPEPAHCDVCDKPAEELCPCTVKGCETVLCCGCVIKCLSCDQNVCPDHIAYLHGDKWCTTCLAEVEDDAARELAEGGNG